jgi:hypothetical protein
VIRGAPTGLQQERAEHRPRKWRKRPAWLDGFAPYDEAKRDYGAKYGNLVKPLIRPIAFILTAMQT